MHPSVNTDALQLTAATTMWALGGALLAGLPVAWTYTVTRRRKEYAQTTAHGLLLLPLSVAGVALLLPSHLAIAVSLAGVFALAHVQGAVRNGGGPRAQIRVHQVHAEQDVVLTHRRAQQERPPAPWARRSGCWRCRR